MSQTSLEQQFKDAGIPVMRGVKVVKEYGTKQKQSVAHSGMWLYRWAKNSYQNYELVKRARGVIDLADTCIGLPAIIVGVGPSLDEAMDELKRVKRRGIMIATDAAFRPLMANGIRPDLVLSFDCKPEQSLLWETVPAHDVPILFDSCSHPKSIASWKGPILFYNHFHQADELSNLVLPHVNAHIGQLPSGGTVGNVALLLSKLIGCSPSILVGFDLCYKQEGTAWRYRSRDYRYNPDTTCWDPGEVKALYDNDERVKRSFMKDFKGTAYRMDPELAYYHQVLLSFITHFKVETINTSRYGALAEAVVTFPLGSAIDRFCPPKTPVVPFYDKIKEITAHDPRLLLYRENI